MAMRVDCELVGADVSKAELVICRRSQPGVRTLSNERRAIRNWLRTLPVPSCIAVEATNTYHLALVEEAYALGHHVYVVDGYRLNRYREGVSTRAKTDRIDAVLLLRYLEREGADLRPWNPPPEGYVTLHRLLHRRALLVKARTQLRQSLADLPQAQAQAQTLTRSLDRLVRALEQQLAQVAITCGRRADIQRCQAIEGIGPITATALANAYARGPFTSSDAFVAFLGLDVRVRDSGKKKGKRCLTKQGDSELRRLLYNAAMAARRTQRWLPVYQRYLARGLKTTQALVAIGRKLARIAFALMKNQSDYRPVAGGLVPQP